VIDRLAPVDIGDVELDDRSGEHLQRVEERERGEGEGGGVDEDAGAFVDRLVDEGDEFLFAVGLGEDDGALSRGLPADVLEIGEGGGAVDLGFALAEAVEVGTVEDLDRFHGRPAPPW
jgi:hypothetical protein